MDFIKIESIVSLGVEKLKIFVFTNVTIHNILIDKIYLQYFLSFLNKISNYKNEDEIIAIKDLKHLLPNYLKFKKGNSITINF